MEQNSRTIMTTGRPGVGKSYLGNFILTNDPHSQVFKSDSDPEGFGVTREIQVSRAYAKHLDHTVEMIDIPGSGDPTLDITDVLNGLVSQVSQKTIHAALILVAAQDNRATGAEALTTSFLKNFFKTTGIDTKEILWLIITRCQELQPDQKFIQGKLNFFKKMGLEIRSDHVILFDSTVGSLKPFVDQVFKIKENQGLVVEVDTEKALKNFSKDVREVSIKDPCVRQDFEQIEMMMRMAMDTNEKLSSQLSRQADALKDMLQASKEDKKMLMAANQRMASQLENQTQMMREMSSEYSQKVEDLNDTNKKLMNRMDAQNERLKKQEERTCTIF